MGMEPYVFSLYQFAMARGEDIRFDSPFSQQLDYNLREYQSIYRVWMPEYFLPFKILHEGHGDPPAAGPRQATTFSGGVDSFYTLLKQHPSQEPLPEYQVSEAIQIYFNMPRYDWDAFDRRSRKLQTALADLNINLIPANTNMRLFLHGRTVAEQHFFLHKAFVGGLTSVGMLLSGEISRYFIPSGKHFLKYGPAGSDWMTDSLLVAEWYETIHHAAALTRRQKIEAIIDESIVQQHLGVCLNRPDHERNCGYCSKCLRTMMTIDLLGNLTAFETFDRPTQTKPVREMSRLYEAGYVQENLDLARERGRSREARLLWLTLMVYRWRRFRARSRR